MTLDPIQHMNELMAKAKAAPDPLLTRREAAQRLGLSPHTLAVWSCTGRVKIPEVRLGRSVRYRLSDVDAFVEASRARSAP